MYNATRLIEATLKSNGLKCQSHDLGNISLVEAGFTEKNCTVKIRFISTDNGNDVLVLTDDFASYPQDKVNSGLRLINELNDKYKYAKFTLTTKGALHAEYNIPASVSSNELGKVALEIALRFVKIIDDAYPSIMRSIWA